MTPSLRQLAHAEALARHCSFRLAAAELHISQPALTRSIQALEAVVGGALFDRLPAGVIPTPAGEVFIEGARRVLGEQKLLQRETAALLGLSSGTLSVASGPYPGDALVPDAMARLIGRYPGLSCRLLELDWTEVVGQLLARQVDLVVADLDAVSGDERFESEPLLDHRFHFVCREEHPLAHRRQLELEDVMAYPLVGNQMPLRFESFFGSAAGGKHFHQQVSVPTFATTRRVLLGADGVTLAPLVQVAQDLEEGRLVLLRTGLLPLRQNSGFIRLRGRTPSPAAAQFMAEVRSIRDDMDRRGRELERRFARR